MKKLILSLMAVAVIFAVALCGCNAGADLQKRVDALEESNSRLEEMVDELERENDLLWDMMSEMGLKEGEFYTLQEAYDAGWLTQEDLKSIAYYHNGGREGNEEIMGEDYQPQLKTPEVIDKMTELSIKQTYCDNLRKQDNAKPSGVTIERYYGAYNGCYAVVLDSIYVVYPADVINEWEIIGGVNINYYDYLSFRIWKAKGV